MKGETIYLTDIVVEVVEARRKYLKTFEKVSFVDRGQTHYKGSEIKSVKKIGVLGETNN
tara:strand:- start:741 stop:917 length:177 start_codon:yes stop_codon:yes gene_type:complete